MKTTQKKRMMWWTDADSTPQHKDESAVDKLSELLRTPTKDGSFLEVSIDMTKLSTPQHQEGDEEAARTDTTTYKQVDLNEDRALPLAPHTPQNEDGLKTCVGYMDTSDFSMMINENPDGGFRWEFLDFIDPKKQEGEVTKIFISTTDPERARRAQNAEVERLKNDVKRYSEMSLQYMSQIQELRSLLERAKGFADFVFGYNTTNGINPKYELEWLSDYAKLTSNAAQGGEG